MANTNDIIKLIKKAEDNWNERAVILKETQKLLDKKGSSVAKAVDELDKTFRRKLYCFPGDITTTRIAKVLKKAIA